MAEPLVLPTFLYIGAAKAGSSWIFEALREHPDVYVPTAKDLQFFDTAYHRGLAWYGSFFQSAGEFRVRGELSHNYFTSEEFADRIARDLPGIKLVCCLREPFERTISAYTHAIALGTASDCDFRGFCSQPSIIRAASYHDNLRPFYDRFPQEDILVCFYDDLVEDPTKFLSVILGHIGADPAYTPACINKRVLPRRAARNEWFGGVAYRVGGVLRGFGFANLVGWVKRSRTFSTIVYRPATWRPEIDPEVEREFRDRISARYDDLQTLIGRDLPRSWRRD